jgi:type IV pilus assembly protein PilB
VQALGGVLVDEGLLTSAQLREALQIQARDGQRMMLGEILVSRGFLTEEQLLRAMAKARHLPFIETPSAVAEAGARALVPEAIRQEHLVLPISLCGNELLVATANPADSIVIEQLERITGFRIRLAVSTAKAIEDALAMKVAEPEPAATPAVTEIDTLLGDLDESEFAIDDSSAGDIAAGEDEASSGPVVKLVNHILASAVAEGASDIHIEPDDGSMRVRFRVDGVLQVRLRPPHRMHAAIASRIKIMARLDISERRIPQDGEIAVRMSGRPIDLRVSTLPGKFGEKIVMRVIDVGAGRLGLDKLGFRPTMLERFRGIISQPHGVVLVTGPTGSGKSTTLYSVLSEFDTAENNVSTVEDPVESNIVGVHQTQVNPKAGMTFSGALRALLRQDPDIIMVGEIRDAETGQIAVQAALTGHLVLSTLHTNDAPSAITRLGNLGVEPFLIAASLRGVLAQRLVRKVCAGCREEYVPDAAQRAALGRYGERATVLARGRGCRKCHERGYSGRIGLYELFTPDAEVLDAIAARTELSKIRAMLASKGFESLWDDGMEKVLAGLTTAEEVHGACRE